MEWNNRTLKTADLRIQITNSHIYAKGTWVMHVREFNWNIKAIGVPDQATEQEAQSAAVQLVREHLENMLDSLK